MSHVDLLIIFNISEIMTGLACLLLGCYLLIKSRATLNIIYFAMSIFFFLNTIFDVLMRASQTLTTIWLPCYNASWLLIFCLFLNLAFVLFFEKTRGSILLYVPALIIFYFLSFTDLFISGFQHNILEYTRVPGQYFSAYFTFPLAYLIGSSTLLILLRNSAKEFYRKKQAGIILMASATPAILGILINEGLLILHLKAVPLAIYCIAITFGFTAYAIIKYSPVPQKVSIEKIASAASSALSDGLILTDSKHEINYANQSACRILSRRIDQLIGKNAEEIFNKNTENINIISTPRGEQAEISLKNIELNNNKGFLYIFRDLSDVVRTEEAIKKLNSEQDLLIRREKAINNFLLQLIKEEDVARLSKLWEEIEDEGGEIKTMLLPVYQLSLKKIQARNEEANASKALTKELEELSALNKTLAEKKDLLEHQSGQS